PTISVGQASSLPELPAGWKPAPRDLPHVWGSSTSSLGGAIFFMCLRLTSQTAKMMTADISGNGAIRNSPRVKSGGCLGKTSGCVDPRARPLASDASEPPADDPTTTGPKKPPMLPSILMKPMALAAAAAPRNIVGIGQNAGRCEYMNVPTR